MNIAIASAHRNNAGRLRQYFQQVAALRQSLVPNSLRVIAVEGDSSDSTPQMLPIHAASHQLPINVVTCSHGQRHFGSTEEPERFVALSKVCNAVFDAVRDDDDYLVYVESDLFWNPTDIVELIGLARRREGGFDIFAPMVMAGPAFYDIWGFRDLGGNRFSGVRPFHRELNGALLELSSAGSCLVIPGKAARRCRVRNDYCLVGWCEDARAKGYRIAVWPHAEVRQA